MIASSELFENICNFSVLDRTESDRFPLHCCLKFYGLRESYSNTNVAKNTLSEFKIYKWRDHHGDHLHEQINVLLLWNDQLITSLINIDIDRAIETTQILYYNAGFYMLASNSSSTLQPPWWEKRCEMLNRQKYSFLGR
jgi:hypothetical protein